MKKTMYILCLLIISSFIIFQGCLQNDSEEEISIPINGDYHTNITATVFSFERNSNDKTGVSAYNDISPLTEENPYYVALPFNNRVFDKDTKYYNFELKNQWVEIIYNKKTCYAQVEDAGPWFVNDENYVFNAEIRPFTEYAKGSKYDIYMVPDGSRVILNKAGIDLSTTVADYLKLPGKDSVHWKFTTIDMVPDGPWLDKISILEPRFNKNSPEKFFIKRNN